MSLSIKSLSFLLLCLSSLVLAKPYHQTDSHSGTSFLDGFDFQAISDPTHGRVNYVDAATAQRENLVSAFPGHFIMRADSTKKLNASGPGRDSVRIQSKKQYTTSVMVFNIQHMPQGCGTWPAVWTVGADWPNQGEIDILEGVNDQSPNQVTLHTNAGCTMPATRDETGTAVGDNCDVVASNNAGCGVKLADTRSYGPTFNSDGGGWYAIERTTTYVKVWFWSRHANNVPDDVKNGKNTVNPDKWGTPASNFPNTSCDFTAKFGPHNIVINLTFCGDWAGAVYANSGCPSTCVDYVNNNPAAFTNAYFDFAWINIYT